MGVVNNARYLEYFEAGRNDLLRKLGVPYTELEKANIGLPVIEASLKFILPARYDDVLTIQCEIRNIPTVRFRIDYVVLLNDQLIAEGHTTHSFIDLEKLKPVRPPSGFLQLLKKQFEKEDELL
jgi:acyl-CoA thioester hydrolase